VTTATSARSTAVGRARLRSVWQWPTTTPGRLSAASFVLVLATVAFGAAATGEAAARRHGADEVASGAEPLLVEATGVYSSLSDADATATTTFLTGGLEPHDRTQRYLDDVRTASGRVAALSQEALKETAFAANLRNVDALAHGIFDAGPMGMQACVKRTSRCSVRWCAMR